MKQEESKKLNYSSLDLIIFAWKKRTAIMIIAGIAAIASIIVSYQITPLFKSEVVMFAPATSSVSKFLYSMNYISEAGLLSFGEEEKVEQLMQILHSNEIRDRIIKDFDLQNHYGIGDNEKYKVTKLHKKFNSNVNFRRTKYMSVVIEVVDADAQIASDMANTIANLVDTITNRVQFDRANAAYQVLVEQQKELLAEIDQIDDSVRALNKLGVFSYEQHTERLTQAYAQALKEGNMAGAKRLRDEMNRIADYTSKYVTFRDRARYQKKQLDELNQSLYAARIEATQHIPQHYVVDWAYPADKKYYPKKSIIVFTTTLLSVIFAYILFLILDAIKRYKTIYNLD